MSYLEITGIRKSFGKKTVLQDISFSLEKGKTLVILGDSGSGKTTLLRILTFLEKADAGKVSLSGETLLDETKLSAKETAQRRQNFGMIFQGFYLFPQYDVYDNILLPVKLSLEKAIKKEVKQLPFFERKKEYRKQMEVRLSEAEKEVKDLLAEFRLSDKEKDYPHSLSGGESQRVAIVRALALHPKVLCFDEPTSALDPLLKDRVAETILRLREKGTTMIVVTHEIPFAAKVADEVLFMENGIIRESGDASILASPKTQELRQFLSPLPEKKTA
jgi:ABC-type polar amino acid transport system ATPase subunit